MYRVDFFLGLIFGIFTLILWYFSSLVIEKSIIPLGFDIFIKFLTIVVGGFVGAGTAFKLGAIKDEKIITKERVKSLNEAILLLIRQMNAVKSSNHVIISAKYIKKAKPFALRQTKNTSLAYESELNINSVSFLIEQNQQQLLLSLIDQQEYFNAMSKSIKHRDEHYLDNIVQVKEDNNIRFSSFFIHEGNELEKLAALEELLEIDTCHDAREHYKRMIDDIDNCITSTGNVIKELVTYSQETYPKEIIFDDSQILDEIK